MKKNTNKIRRIAIHEIPVEIIFCKMIVFRPYCVYIAQPNINKMRNWYTCLAETPGAPFTDRV